MPLEVNIRDTDGVITDFGTSIAFRDGTVKKTLDDAAAAAVLAALEQPNGGVTVEGAEDYPVVFHTRVSKVTPLPPLPEPVALRSVDSYLVEALDPATTPERKAVILEILKGQRPPESVEAAEPAPEPAPRG